jgi:polygalacturonase
MLTGQASATVPAQRGRGRRSPADAAADRIVASVRRPRFPARYFPVTDFGAKGDGAFDCTAAFRNAIAAALDISNLVVKDVTVGGSAQTA